MNKLEFVKGMEKVLAFWPTPNEQKEPGEFKAYSTWLDVIYEKVKWMQATRFEKVMDELLEVRPRFRKDLDHRRIVAIYRELAEQNQWEKQESHECKACAGIRFVYIWVEDKKGHQFKAMRGCATCNPKMSHVHPDFKEIDGPPAEAFEMSVERIKKIPPAFAQCLLGLADAAKLKVHDEIASALVEAACQPDAGRDPKTRGFTRSINDPVASPIKRRNELVRDLAMAPPVTEAGTAEEQEPAKTAPQSEAAMSSAQPSPAAVTQEEPAEEGGIPAF